MYALIFAGGVGQRLWPISRKNTPKQFSPMLGNKSSLELAVARLRSIVPSERIYISTNQRYQEIVCRQLPDLPEANFILEPTRRDLAAAVAFSFFRLQQDGCSGPILFQWGDNYIRNEDGLRNLIQVGLRLIERDPQRIVFLGETPRFASENLGYIEHGPELGRVEGVPYYQYISWAYRPDLETCKKMVEAGNYLWNTGYFVTTIEFIFEQYRRLAPEITSVIDEILRYRGTPQEAARLQELYPTIPAMHFDESFLMRLEREKAVMLKGDLGWSDPGTLYSLKEALQTSSEANVTTGEVVAVETSDSLIVNEEGQKTVSVMGLQGVIVVNTPDTLLVISKDSVRNIRKLLEELEKQGKGDLL